MTPISFSWRFLATCLALATACDALAQNTPSLGSNTVLSLTTLAPLPGRTLSGLVQGLDGSFYGTTEYGGTLNQGAVFQVTAGGVLRTLYSFTGGNDGANPLAGLALSPDGSLYGTTSSGADTGQDPSGAGTVFRITTNGTFSTIYTFTGGNDGDTPSARLVLGPDGDFYGTTEYGGADGYGCIFKVTPGGAEMTIYSFSLSTVGNAFALSDGSSPVSALVLGTNGSFYGTTQSGGANGAGTVFSVTLDGTLTTLVSFSSVNGGNGTGLPGPQLALGTDGNFYGTTYGGGALSKGTIFQMTPGGALTTIYSFTGGPDGGNPVGGLALGSDGYFYGTTSAGEASMAQDPSGLGYGTVFQASPTGTVTNLYSFSGADDGGSPYAPLVQSSDGAFYGTTANTAFRLSFISLPSIITQPTNQTSAPGGSAAFSVIATGSAPLGYQWQLDGTNLAGAISSVLILTNVQLAQAGYYSVTVGNSGGSVTSSAALFTVTAPPAIISQPASQTVGAALTANFSVTAIGTPPLSYQWRLNGTNLSRATLSTLAVTNVQLTSAGNYSVVVSGAGGSVTSSNAVLSVNNAPPTITKQPLSQTAGVGQLVVFNVLATGTPPLGYQWNFWGTNLPGATATNLTLNNLDSAQGGLYSVTVSNAFGTVTSSNALLKVILTPLFLTQPQGRTVTGLTNITLSASAAGATPLNYQWFVDGALLAGATNATLTLTNAAASQSGNYVLVVNNAYGNTTSSPPALVLVENTATAITLAGRSTNAPFFASPAGAAVDNAGNVYIADSNNSTIRKITPNGLVTILAGKIGAAGSSDGSTTNARFNSPNALAVDATGNIYVCDSGNSTIRSITPAGVVSTFAGVARITGATDGASNIATFFFPGGVALNSSNNLYVADTENSTIRKITPAAVVSTVAGSARANGNFDAFTNKARFSFPMGIAVDVSNNVYVADVSNNSIRKITPPGFVSTFAGSKSDASGTTDGSTTNARFSRPSGLAVDQAGNVYVADTANQLIRMITRGGVVVTLAGMAGAGGIADGTGTQARFNGPLGIAVGSDGNLYVADSGNSAIRKLFPAGTAAAPSFPIPLQSQKATAGTTVVFTSGVAGSTPMGFQWQFGGVNLLGATGSSVTLSNVSPAQAGQYRLIATNFLGKIISGNAVLAVVPAVEGEIINPARVQNSFSFGIPTITGKSYTLEYTDSLSSPVWTQLQTVPGNGNVMTMTDLGAAFPTRFYRVLIH